MPEWLSFRVKKKKKKKKLSSPRSATVLSTITLPSLPSQNTLLWLKKRKKNFSNFSAAGGASEMEGGAGGADELYVFTNGVAGISAAMATNHMTRCIRLPQTGCSEAWCERATLHLPKSCPCLAAQSCLVTPKQTRTFTVWQVYFGTWSN